MMMRKWHVVVSILCFLAMMSLHAQEETAELDLEKAEKVAAEANNYIYQGNQELESNEFEEAEVEYRKAISKDASNPVAPYNLGNAYYRNESLLEASTRYQQAAKTATEKSEKHGAWHNLGNIHMKMQEYEKAVESYKNALRNNPNDEETRYNYALAKELLKKEQDGGGGDDNDENQDQNKDQQNKDQNQEGENEDENQENQDQEKQDQEGEDQKDQEGENDEDQKGDQKEDQKDKNQGGDKPKEEQQQQKPRPNQLSPQQVKNLLEAANNEENKVQDKINVQKAKGPKTKAEKDW